MTAFAEALIGSPASYFMAGIVALWAALMPFGKRALEMGSFALAGVVMYVLSTAIITSYHSFPGEDQVAVWTSSLGIVGLLYTAILIVRLFPRSPIYLLAAIPGLALVIGGFFDAWIADMGGGAFRRSQAWFVQYVAIAILAFLCFVTVKKNDFLATLIWGILFIAEGIGAAQVFDCQFLHGPQSVTDGSACAQVYNWSFAPHLPTALPTLILAWILFRWFRPRLR